jgi:hypothetical protein
LANIAKLSDQIPVSSKHANDFSSGFHWRPG